MRKKSCFIFLFTTIVVVVVVVVVIKQVYKNMRATGGVTSHTSQTVAGCANGRKFDTPWIYRCSKKNKRIPSFDDLNR